MTHDRPRGVTAVSRALALLLLGGLFFCSIIATPAPAHADGTEDASKPLPLSSEELIIDRSEIIDETKLLNAYGKIERSSQQPKAQVAVFTTDKTYEDDYETEMFQDLARADKDHHIIKDGHLREDLLLLVVNPRQNRMGVYLGDNLAEKDLSEEITDMRTYLLPTGEQVDPDPDNAVFVASMTYLVHTDSVIDPKAPPQTSETSAEDHLSDAYAKAFNAMMPFGIMMIGFVMIIGVVKIFTRPY